MANLWKRAFARADSITAEIKTEASKLRPDISEAVIVYSEITTKDKCTRPEILGLESRLDNGETVRFMTSGDGVSLVVVTDRRLLVLNDSDNKRVSLEYLLADMSNIGWVGGAAFGKLSFTVGGLRSEVPNVPKRHGIRLLEAVQVQHA